MSKVPRLDLAPKLNRPLQLWNPLDYLRLLYWVFFFPQALRWYVDRFGGGYILESEMNWRKGWEILRQNAIQQRLLLQGFLLTCSVSVMICGYLGRIDFYVDWSSMVRGMFFGVVLGMVISLAWGVAWGVVVGVTAGVVVSIAGGLAQNLVLGLVWGLIWGLGWGVVVGIVWDLGVYILKDYQHTGFVSWLFNLQAIQHKNWLTPSITPLFSSYVRHHLQHWLRQDWEAGVHNINQLLQYTQQLQSILAAMNRVLEETPSEQLVWRVSRLAQAPWNWRLVGFASAPISSKLTSSFHTEQLFLPIDTQAPSLPSLGDNTRLDTAPRATAAGFWHLHEGKPDKAAAAFAVVRSILYGEEMYLLAQTLDICNNAKEFDTIAQLQLPPPPTPPHLRPITWTAIAHLRRTIEDSRLVGQSASRAARSFALNRALGELTTLVNQSDILPEAERELILRITETWQFILLQETISVGNITITEPVRNPYTIGDPVEGIRFVGRDDILRQLEELWVMGQQLQSVVIYGHRRMGKTSILRNAANRLGARIRVAYVNLQQVSDAPQGVGEVLMAICDEISATVGLPPPDDEKLLNLPYPTFKRYLRQVETHLQTELDNAGLIIALDEFEQIEDLIEKGQIDPSFMGSLRGSIQQSPKIAFALAGLHTLDEMTADYFQPFFASVLPIRVKFLTSGATRTILANPDDGDFPLDYSPETLDGIYQLTAGQPFLVQLIGFQLVRRYNDWVFDAGRSREPLFTPEDLEAIIDNPEFFQRGRYYFTGVWNQAAQGASGQQAVLTAIAPYPDGLPRRELARETGLDGETLENAINTLIRHDVIEERDDNLRIIVELFRRWVVKNHGNRQENREYS